MVEVAGTYRGKRGDIAPERAGYRAPQPTVPDSVFGALQEMQAGLAQTNENVAELTVAVSKITATWRDSLVKQIGAVALAALGIIGAQRALAPTPPPATTMIQQTELQIRADGCAKMANGSDSEYQRCMVRDVVAPNTPSVKAFVNR